MRTIKNLIGSVLISMAVFSVWALILPGYDERVHLQSVILSKSGELETKNGAINKIIELDQEYQTRYAELKRLSLVVPSDKHVEEVITILDKIFSATGVPLTDMSISSGEGPLGSSHNIVAMEFASDTNYDSIINFLYAIEKSLRLIDPTSLTISKTQNIENESGSLTVLFKANAYFLNKGTPTGGKSVIQKQTSEE